MARRQYGTRWTTGCGHSWRWRHTVMTVDFIRGAVMDCPFVVDRETDERCCEYLIIPFEQFEGMDQGVIPVEVHAPLFHKYMHQQDEGWPEDGAGTGFVEFDLDGDECVMHGQSAGKEK